MSSHVWPAAYCLLSVSLVPWFLGFSCPKQRSWWSQLTAAASEWRVVLYFLVTFPSSSILQSDSPITFLCRQSSPILHSSLDGWFLSISLSGRSNVENGKIDSFERGRPDKTSQYRSPFGPSHPRDEQRQNLVLKTWIEIFWLKNLNWKDYTCQ